VTLGIGGCSVLVAAIAWTLVQRDGDPATARATSLTASTPR
jgi:hypothetical protein